MALTYATVKTTFAKFWNLTVTPSFIGLVGHIYGLDTVKQVQDWISTGGTSNHHQQGHGNCKTTQDFSCVKIDMIDYDQVGRFSQK